MNYRKKHSQIFIIFCIILFVSIFTVKAAPGDLDLTFGNGGKVITPVGKFSADFGYASALQSDGKIVVAGQTTDGLRINFVVVRINTDGTLDKSFGTHGFAARDLIFTNIAFAVAIQPDGKIVAGGHSTNLNTFRQAFTFVRFNSDGSIDNTFGTNGAAQVEFENLNSVATSLAVQSDGKIVAAGFLYGNNQLNPSGFSIARLNADGSIDNSFDGDGKVTVFEGFSRANSVVIQSDGKIVAGGFTNSSFALARLNTDGSFDNSFDNDGKLTTQIGTSSGISSLALQTDGKIVAAGTSSSGSNGDFTTARYNTDGSLDTTFDTDGIVVTDYLNQSDSAKSVKIQSDGKIVLGGNTNLNSSTLFTDFLAVRYNSDGSLDNSFDNDGKAFTAISNSDDQANAVVIQSDGKIVLVGYSFSPDYQIALVRYNTNGSLDSTFADDGISLIELGNSIDVILGVTVQPDGKIIAVGYSYNGVFRDITVVRYNSDGSLDSTFGSNGVVTTSVNNRTSIARKVIIQPDGKILVSGTSFNSFIVVRYNSDGSLDNTFGTDGIVRFQIGTSSNDLYDHELQADGKIVVAGTAFISPSSNVAVARLNSDGSFDTTFDGDGKATTLVGTSTNRGTSVEIQADGKIVVGGFGSFTGTGEDFILVRYNTDGSLDTSFDGDGKLNTSFSNLSNSDVAFALAIQVDGKIVLAGGSLGDFALARYNSDGSLDTTFDGDGKVLTDFGPLNYIANQIWDLIIQPDGKLIAAGTVVTDFLNSTLVRYNSDGSLDNSFGNNGVVITQTGSGDSEFPAVSLQPDGKIIGGGYSNNGQNADFMLLRFLGDGMSLNRVVFDFDGDGKSDISVFRPSTSAWYLLQSQSGFSGIQFGVPTDKLAPADYDGDGKTDIAVFRDGNWYRLNSSNNQFNAVHFGTNEDLPRPGDFDGDGKADIAVFRPSNGTWYWLNSSNGQFNGVRFGTVGDIPVIADFDGDGKSDLAVFRPSTGDWYWLNSSNGQFNAVHFGTGEDIPAVGDFDGDGKTDISVFRPSNGTWYRLNSSDGQFVGIRFGASGDVPTVGDFDGDGKSDVAVFRPSNGNWYLLNSQSGFAAIQFGIDEDKPIPAAFQ